MQKNIRKILKVIIKMKNKKCFVNKRCKHICACKNYSTTNDMNILSPIVYELEKIIINASDEVAEKLYKQNSKLFIQKYYNEAYAYLNK